jgi:hypothetical protein
MRHLYSDLNLAMSESPIPLMRRPFKKSLNLLPVLFVDIFRVPLNRIRIIMD